MNEEEIPAIKHEERIKRLLKLDPSNFELEVSRYYCTVMYDPERYYQIAIITLHDGVFLKDDFNAVVTKFTFAEIEDDAIVKKRVDLMVKEMIAKSDYLS